MTNTETTRIVAEWMGLWFNSDFKKWVIHGKTFNPATNANDEQLAIKHAREYLSLAEQLRAVNYVSDQARNRLGARLGCYESWIETGDWTKAIAHVLAERVHAMHMSTERVHETPKNDHVGGVKEQDDE